MNKTSLNAAFKEMRKAGLIARQNFSCCGGCGGYEICTEISEKIDADPTMKSKIKGMAFYHKQDAESLRDYGCCYLSYGPAMTEKHGQVGGNTVEVGTMVFNILKSHGIEVEWDGKEETRIKIGHSRRESLRADRERQQAERAVAEQARAERELTYVI